MENRKLSLRKWLVAIPFIGAAKQGLTALGPQGQMGFVTKQGSVYTTRSLSLGAKGTMDISWKIGYDVE